MSSALVYSIALLPKHYDDDLLLQRYADKYRELCLRSLKSDPDSFSSSYDQESQQPSEFWAGRLLDPKALLYIAIRQNLGSKVEGVVEGPDTILHSEWVGILVRLGPKIVDTGSFSDVSSWKTVPEGAPRNEMDRLNSRNPQLAAYHLGGFYVAPETRGQGLGARLVRTALDAIAADCRNTNWSEAICTVGTEYKNATPQRLFAKMGFSNVAIRNIQQGDGRHVTEIVWRQDFSFNIELQE